MNKKTVLLLVLFSTTLQANNEAQMVNESKQAIKGFATQLKSQLQQGMKAGGVVNAINVCHDSAEKIAQQYSKQLGWTITRTSLKLRNKNNHPDAWEKQVLNAFEQRQQAGETIAVLDYSEIITHDGQRSFRYMKAMPTKGVCLGCHGAILSDDVLNVLHKTYPNDQATGFKMGDIRGAFSITRPLNE